MSKTVTNTNIPKTIHFNVGGKNFEILSNLIIKDNNKLSRMVLDSWKRAKTQQEDTVVFIDRDGDQFGFVLNYLRFRKVNLPITISLDNFMKELKFFEVDVKDGTVVSESSYLSETFAELTNEKKKLKDALLESQKENKHLLLAMDIMRHFSENGIQIRRSWNSGAWYICGEEVKANEYNVILLNRSLGRLGLKVYGWNSKSDCEVRLLNE